MKCDHDWEMISFKQVYLFRDEIIIKDPEYDDDGDLEPLNPLSKYRAFSYQIACLKCRKCIDTTDELIRKFRDKEALHKINIRKCDEAMIESNKKRGERKVLAKEIWKEYKGGV